MRMWVRCCVCSIASSLTFGLPSHICSSSKIRVQITLIDFLSTPRKRLSFTFPSFAIWRVQQQMLVTFMMNVAQSPSILLSKYISTSTQTQMISRSQVIYEPRNWLPRPNPWLSTVSLYWRHRYLLGRFPMTKSSPLKVTIELGLHLNFSGINSLIPS
eukprot:19707_2